MGNPISQLSDGQRRRIGSTLAMLDKAICDFEELAAGREIRSVLYEETNRFDSQQREHLRREAALIREILKELRSDLSLQPSKHDCAAMVKARCATLWSNVIDLEPRKLRRYGAVSSEAAHYLDLHLPPLIARLSGLSP